jgi:hypothetical protein
MGEDDIRGMLGAVFLTLAPQLDGDDLTKAMAEFEATLRDVIRTGEWIQSSN